MPIFDQGYQHWSGQLTGHAWRWLAITRHGLRIALSSWLVRLVLIAAALPAIVLVFVVAMWGLLEQKSDLITAILPLLGGALNPEILAGPRAFRVEVWTIVFSYFLAIEQRFAMVLVLFVGPNLISQDLRYNAMPLYFSRPLRRFDYVLGKLGVIVTLLSAVIIAPAIVAYVLGMIFSLDVSILRDTFRILLASVVYGLVISISAGLLILALSTLSRNSRYVALFWIGMWFITSAVAVVLQTIQFHEARRAAEAGEAVNPGDAIQRAIAASRDDWRPLVSYTSNLTRIGQQLIGIDAAWLRMAKLQPENTREIFLNNVLGPQYPWYWSALVLLGWLVLSLCILNFCIKSLDRLR
ncbi:MAG: ABC transporter permease [Pirellulales bacterium]